MNDNETLKVEQEKTQSDLDHEMKCILNRVTHQCTSLNKLTNQFNNLLNTLLCKNKDDK